MANGEPVDLFDAAAASELATRGPLAARRRPRNLDEVIGQRQLLAKGTAFRSLVESDRLSSAVFFGPPGTGKTTVARLVAQTSKKAFVQLSAVQAGVRDVREVLESARRRLGEVGRGTLLFLDEIHRFSRAQQDALLPGVEDGLVVLIGATTENPYFSLNAPLLSRSVLYRFELLSVEELSLIARGALADEKAAIDDDALAVACVRADGDARAVLTTMEVAIAIAQSRSGDRPPRIDRTIIDAARQTTMVRHGPDEHYDLLSAFIKSMRGSDPDAAVYWLARLLAAGEDPRAITRRMIILASEDIGLADPTALMIATASAAAVEHVGLPEVALNLAQGVIYLAMAPKSNHATLALSAAEDDIANGPLGMVPSELKDAHYAGAAKLGHGVGYEYPHDDPSGVLAVRYLPAELRERRYYEPSTHGREAKFAELLASWRAARAPKAQDLREQGQGPNESEVGR